MTGAAAIAAYAKLSPDAKAYWQSRLQVSAGAGGGYSGPGDAVSGWTGWYGLRAYNAAYAAAGGNAIIVRAVAGANAGTTKTITFLANGNLDTATASTFGGTDATGLGAITGTTLTFTGGTIGDQVTGGTTAPGTLITAGASPTWTVNISQTVASATLTLAGGLFATQAYDHTGNGHTLTQATNTPAVQPILAMNVLGSGNTLPALYFGAGSGGQALQLFGYSGTTAQPTSWSYVAERTGLFTAQNYIFLSFTGGTFQIIGFANGANLVLIDAGTQVNESATDGILHAVQNVLNGATSAITIDSGSTITGLSAGTSAIQTAISLGGNLSGANQPFHGWWAEGGFQAGVALTPTQQAAMYGSQHPYWGTA